MIEYLHGLKNIHLEINDFWYKASTLFSVLKYV